LEIPEIEKKKAARRLVKILYDHIDKPLVSKDPWAELAIYAAEKKNAQKLIEIIKQLESYLGPLIIDTSTSSSEIHSSPHYDFHLPSEKSRKRKVLI
jgi:hypothetical protein